MIIIATIELVITNFGNLIVWLMLCVYGETFHALRFDKDNNSDEDVDDVDT